MVQLHFLCYCRKADTHLGFRPSVYTGSSAFRLPSPERSTAIPMYGPITGIFLAKPAMVPRKSPKRTMMPYSSTQKPMSGHLNKMSARPPKKAAVPLALFFRAKKRSVFCGPIMIVRPMRKRICFRAVSDEGRGGRGWREWYVSHSQHRSVKEHQHASYQEEAPYFVMVSFEN